MTLNQVINRIEALALAHEKRPQLMVLDLMLPRRNGIEVCRELRADPRHVSLKVLMLTARDGIEDRVQPAAEGKTARNAPGGGALLR